MSAGTPMDEKRAPDASAIDRLLAAPHRFEFHQAVRLLHIHWRRLPEGQRPALRYRNTLSLAFPASQLRSIECQSDADGRPERLELTPAFMGLLGVNGALPPAYSEQFARREIGDRDGAARAFLDMFQHRAVTLFHEAWRKHRLPLLYEIDRRDRYLPMALSLVGLGEPALQRRLHGDVGGVPDDVLAFYGGLLQRRAVGAQHLQNVLAAYFGVPVLVTQFVGRWFELGTDSQMKFCPSRMCLGRNTVLGQRVWQRDLRARVSIGPVNRAQHQRFLPGGTAALALRELLTLVSGVSLEYEVRLILRADDVAGVSLPGTPPAHGAGHRLGWDTFVMSRPGTEDREEAVYDIHTLGA